MKKEKVENLYRKIKEDAEASGYRLNPDVPFTKSLIEGLLVNQERYGYQSCPCRLASGEKEKDLDIVCPCDYRDPDLVDHGACYCALYVDEDIVSGKKEIRPVPERRTQKDKEMPYSKKSASGLSYPVWRCRVCGYLCARKNPPHVCPICKASKERFEVFIEDQAK